MNVTLLPADQLRGMIRMSRALKRRYTPEDDAYLLANYGRRPWRDIAIHIGRSIPGAQNRHRRLERDMWARQAAGANERSA